MFKLDRPCVAFAGLFRQCAVESSCFINFVPNGLFVGLHTRARKALRDGKFDVTVVRSRCKAPAISYRTVFGPAVRHRGVVYATSSGNLRWAAFRLFHDKVGVSVLHSRQLEVLSSIDFLLWRSAVKRNLSHLLADRRHWAQEVAIAVELPHEKRALRRSAYANLCEQSREASVADNFMGGPFHPPFVQLNMKPLEWAKPGKNARVVCDLTTEASLRGGWFISVLKEAMAGLEDVCRGARIVFVESPDMDVLSYWFSRMRFGDVSLYFSDDSAFSLSCTDGMLWFNADIASCDSSNGPALFESLEGFVPDIHRHTMAAMVEQCSMPCRLGVGSRTLRFRPVRYFEYSGSLLTTVLNNIASRTIAALIFRFRVHDTVAATRRWLESFVSTLPWSVTCEFCSRFEEIQFLKCSPAYSIDRSIVSVLNLGVILRALGQCSYDLPGRGSQEVRAYEFNSALVRGMVYAGDHSLLRVLRRKFVSSKVDVRYNSRIVEFMRSSGNKEVADDSLCARYGLEISHMHDLCSLLCVAEFGDVIDCHASRVIMAKDYGL